MARSAAAAPASSSTVYERGGTGGGSSNDNATWPPPLLPSAPRAAPAAASGSAAASSGRAHLACSLTAGTSCASCAGVIFLPPSGCSIPSKRCTRTLARGFSPAAAGEKPRASVRVHLLEGMLQPEGGKKITPAQLAQLVPAVRLHAKCARPEDAAAEPEAAAGAARGAEGSSGGGQVALSLELPPPVPPRSYTVLDEAGAAAALRAITASRTMAAPLAEAVLAAVARGGEAGVAMAQMQAAVQQQQTEWQAQHPGRSGRSRGGAAAAPLAAVEAAVAALHDASLLVRVSVDEERRYVAHTHASCWAAPPYTLEPAPPAAVAAVEAARAAAVARQRLTDAGGPGSRGGSRESRDGGSGGAGSSGAGPSSSAGGGGEEEERGRAAAERERVQAEKEAAVAAGVTPSGKRAKYDEEHFFVPEVGTRVDGQVDASHVTRLHVAILGRVAISPGISEAALLERFSAFSACHVREQLAALEAAGLLRGAALEVRAPRLFGSGEAAPLKHYFPAPGVGLGWVAARG
eukprot:Transcript_18235.p1 GENE.Transcript_18235~~Transcript_18235.p1  ORF type:complete len:520 (+),score=188.59 Transcript_18235:995-2554(+)